MNAPVMLSVRVPPSASSTSQSRVTVRSPMASRSMTARRLRPMSRWISVVRPSTLPPRSRFLRGLVLPGSMLYSAVSQPRPLPFIQAGTSGSIGRAAEHGRAAGLDQHAARRGARVAALDFQRAEFVRLAVVVSHVYSSSHCRNPQSSCPAAGFSHRLACPAARPGCPSARAGDWRPAARRRSAGRRSLRRSLPRRGGPAGSA